MHARNYVSAVNSAHIKTAKIEEYCRNTLGQYFYNICQMNDTAEFSRMCDAISKENEIYLDPIAAPLTEFVPQMARMATQVERAVRLSNALGRLMQKARKARFWEGLEKQNELLKVLSTAKDTSEMVVNRRKTRGQ